MYCELDWYVIVISSRMVEHLSVYVRNILHCVTVQCIAYSNFSQYCIADYTGTVEVVIRYS